MKVTQFVADVKIFYTHMFSIMNINKSYYGALHPMIQLFYLITKEVIRLIWVDKELSVCTSGGIYVEIQTQVSDSVSVESLPFYENLLHSQQISFCRKVMILGPIGANSRVFF